MDEPLGIDSRDFADLLKAMPDNQGVLMVKDPLGSGDFYISIVREADLKKLAEDKGLFHVIYQITRPGTGYFSNYLEHKYFPPETPLNDEFQFRPYKWRDLMWGIISIPIEKKDLCYEAAQVSKLRIANGIPVRFRIGGLIESCAACRKENATEKMPGATDIQWFPLDCDNAYTLEFSRENPGVYEPGGAQDERIWEDFKVKELWKEFGVPDKDPWEE